MEVIDIGLDNLEPVTFNLQEDKPNSEGEMMSEPPSVNFGPGVELLMNDKKISTNSSTSLGSNCSPLHLFNSFMHLPYSFYFYKIYHLS